MKSIYPISNSSQATKCLGNWEFAAAEVEYLFMSQNSQHQGQIRKGNYDFKYPSINLLNRKPQIENTSGGYKLKNAVSK
ncbi:hypothetical protein [Cuspidothrix issatschenkoi]|uniref:hypothetical protein n=1 Tax=Cuspidothrix issatschenkoi TaxID=230752 RepID=UPI002AD47A93|nr:hypothetical protein [Cuspidothrix issatschenkoi]